MNRLNALFLKLVRWSGWLLLPLTLAFLATGYAVTGRYGLTTLFTEEQALSLHRLFHVPLLLLLVVHVLPATVLAMQRWGWIRP
jgi:hypothetical protein